MDVAKAEVEEEEEETLSAEIIEENVFHQTSELQSLESIYGNELRIIVADKEFMIDVHLNVNDSVRVLLGDSHQPTSVCPAPSPAPLSTSSLVLPPLKSAVVTHLPPVTIYIRFTDGYPSSEMPYCHLSARWLSTELADKLKCNMKEMYSPGWPVVFDWVNYIGSEFINDYCHLLLKTGQTTVKRPLEETDDKPRPLEPHPMQLLVRSISEFNDVEEYDKYESHKEFLSGKHECSICLEDKHGEEFTDPCQDCDGPGIYCKWCIMQYCKTLINEGRVATVTCPHSSCEKRLSDALLCGLLDKKTFEKYQLLRQQVELDSIPGVVYCPRSSCNSCVMSDPNSDLAVCDDCGFPFCKVCRQTWHGVEKCSMFDKQLEKEIDDEEDAKKKPKEVKLKSDELKSMLWFRSRADVHQCPTCTTAIQKTGGCNKMTCWKCGNSFCWLCNERISGYGHFSSGGCELFRTVDYHPPSEEKPRIDIEQVQESTLNKLLHTACPRCGQVLQKDSNKNWVCCKKCLMQYCHQCGEPCYGKYHFNEQFGCKQFSTVEEDIEFIKRQENTDI